jgi:hypothetical protein
MKYRGIILFILGILVFGCEPQLKPKKPADLISKDAMVLVLYDMFILNSAKGIDHMALENNSINPEYYLLKKHNIDSTQFAQSNNYYAHDIDVYSAIIENVKSKITAEKEKYEAINKKEEEVEKKRGKDSINRNAEKLPVIKPSVSRIKEVD